MAGFLDACGAPWRASNSAFMAGGGRYVQRETLKAFGLSSRQVFTPGFGADRRAGLNSPYLGTWK